MNLLHIDSSALGGASASRELSAVVVARLRTANPAAAVTYRDLDATPLPHFTARSLAKSDTAESDAAEQSMADFLAADVIVIGAPMYNFSIPSTLKAWIDRIAVAGKTFRYTSSGPEGLAKGKRVIIISSRGSAYGESNPMDFQEAYLRHLFGFLGVQDIEFVRAEGLAGSATPRDITLAAAKSRIDELLPVAA